MIAGSAARRYQLFGIALGLVLFQSLGACQLDTEPDDSSSGQIQSFVFTKQNNPALPEDASGTIVGDRITVTVPGESDVTSLVPSIRFEGARVSPPSGEAQNFSAPVTYTVVTPEGREYVYTVTVVKAASGSKEITQFSIDDVEGTINGTDITVIMPHGTDLTMLRGDVVHNGLSVRPESGTVHDFSEPVQYIVTARNGSTASYTVHVSVANSDAKEIIGFAVGDTMAEINGTQITLSLPFGTDLSKLAPSIVHTGVSVSPESGRTQNFLEPVQYTVTAADGTTQVYTVTASTLPNSAKAITRFTLTGRQATIEGTMITLTVPFGTDIDGITPVVQHTGQSLSPASSEEQDFSKPVIYTVTAADGTTAQYTVIVTVAKSDAKRITTFIVRARSATIVGSNITVTVPFDTDLTALTPTIVFDGANVSPASGVPQDFSSPVEYTVTAHDGSTRVYTVTVTRAPSDAREITSFTVLGIEGTIIGTAITLTVPFGTNRNGLAPVISHNGVSLSPASGTPRDFRSPVMYTVTAIDGSMRTYTVTITEALNSARNITSFTLAGVAGMIVDGGEDTGTISVTVPFGTTLTGLTPTIVHQGDSIEPPGPQNFTTPVEYTVTADNGEEKVYTVTVTVAPASSARSITAFSINGVAGVIDGTSITVTLPSGADITSLTPTIAVSEFATVSPMTGAPQDFSNPLVYTVTAQNEMTRDYTVSVFVQPLITAFVVAEATTTTIGNSTISVLVPHGTDVTTLMPTITAEAGATLNPMSGTPQDFSSPVDYIVTDASMNMKTYTVTVTVLPPS